MKKCDGCAPECHCDKYSKLKAAIDEASATMAEDRESDDEVIEACVQDVQDALSEMDATTQACWNGHAENIPINKEPDGQLSITILNTTVYA